MTHVREVPDLPSREWSEVQASIDQKEQRMRFLSSYDSAFRADESAFIKLEIMRSSPGAPAVYELADVWPSMTGVQYPEQVERIAAYLKSTNVLLVMDVGGAARAVAQMLQKAGVSPMLLLNSKGGAGQAKVVDKIKPGSAGEVSVSKIELAGTMTTVMSSKRLIVKRSRIGVAAFERVSRALKSYGYKTTESGNTKFEAQGSAKDDLVSALQLGLWAAENLPNNVAPAYTSVPTPISRMSKTWR